LSPRLSSRQPMEAAASPLPKEDTTPPVTKMYFADIGSSLELLLKDCAGWGAQSIMPENYWDGNVEKMGSCQCQLPVARKTKSPNRLAIC
jgi:hypothetical protein